MADIIWVYVIGPPHGRGPSKIGISIQPGYRCDELATASSFPLAVLFAEPCLDREEAMAIEHSLHGRFEGYQLHREWFDISGVTAKDAVIAETKARRPADVDVEMSDELLICKQHLGAKHRVSKAKSGKEVEARPVKRQAKDHSAPIGNATAQNTEATTGKAELTPMQRWRRKNRKHLAEYQRSYRQRTRPAKE